MLDAVGVKQIIIGLLQQIKYEYKKDNKCIFRADLQDWRTTRLRSPHWGHNKKQHRKEEDFQNYSSQQLLRLK